MDRVCSLPAAGVFGLPQSCVVDIFERLTVGERVVACGVSNTWRASLSLPLLWRTVDLSRSSRERRVNDGLLRALQRVAGDLIWNLDVSGRLSPHEEAEQYWRANAEEPAQRLTIAAFLAFLGANAGSLGSVRLSTYDGSHLDWNFPICIELTAAFCAAAPRSVIYAGVGNCGSAQGRLALDNAAPFENLVLEGLEASLGTLNDDEAPAELALAADLATHACLRHLSVTFARLSSAAVRDTFFDAVIASNVMSLELWDCDYGGHFAAVLSRLLLEGQLSSVFVLTNQDPLFDGPGATLFAAAVRAPSRLTRLHLHVDLWHNELNAGLVVIDALVDHRSLKMIGISGFPEPGDREVVGTALSRLVSGGPGSTLEELVLQDCFLTDVGLRPLMGALEHSTLKSLDISSNKSTVAFHPVVLQAVRANCSLRSFRANPFDSEFLCV